MLGKHRYKSKTWIWHRRKCSPYPMHVCNRQWTNSASYREGRDDWLSIAVCHLHLWSPTSGSPAVKLQLPAYGCSDTPGILVSQQQEQHKTTDNKETRWRWFSDNSWIQKTMQICNCHLVHLHHIVLELLPCNGLGTFCRKFYYISTLNYVFHQRFPLN